jgi:hypothetical protein
MVEVGPAVHGWDEDQRWTLVRVATLIGRLFHIRYTPRGVSYLLHRIGYNPQVPAHGAVQRDEAANRPVAYRDLGQGSRLAAATGAPAPWHDAAAIQAVSRPPAVQGLQDQATRHQPRGSDHRSGSPA